MPLVIKCQTREHQTYQRRMSAISECISRFLREIRHLLPDCIYIRPPVSTTVTRSFKDATH